MDTNMIGYLLSIGGIIVSVIIAYRTVPRKGLVADSFTEKARKSRYTNLEEWRKELENARKKGESEFAEINKLCDTCFVIKNFGNQKIDFSDMATKDPLRIHVENGKMHKIEYYESVNRGDYIKNMYDFQVVQKRAPYPEDVLIKFDYWPPKYTFHVVVQHTGKAKLRGELKESEVKDAMQVRAKYAVVLLFAELVVSAIFGFFKLLAPEKIFLGLLMVMIIQFFAVQYYIQVIRKFSMRRMP